MLPTSKKLEYNRLYTYELNEVSDENHVSGNIHKLLMELAFGSTEKVTFGSYKVSSIRDKVQQKEIMK